MRFNLIPLTVLFCVVAGGCGPSVRWTWIADTPLASMKSEEFPDEDAVIISRDHHLINRHGAFVFHQHDLVKVFTEKGRDLFSRIEIPLGSKGKLVDIFGRVIRLDGSIVPLRDEDVIEEEGETLVDNKKVRQTKAIVRLPGAQVGSIIEYGYTIQYPFAIGSHNGRVANGVARVQKYKFTFDVLKRFKFQLRTYNTTSQVRMSRNGAFRRLQYSTEDVAKSKDEEFSPDWSMRDPWWRFALYSGNKPSWNSAALQMGKHFYDDGSNVFNGYSTGLSSSTSGCKNRNCLITKAIRYVTKQTDYSGPKSIWRARALERVVAERTANSTEKAFLLFQALSDLGIRAKFAVGTRLYTKPIDANFPTHSWFNHVLIAVSNEHGNRVFIDPSCEHCSLGQLPDSTRGIRTLVIEPADIRNSKFTTTWESAVGTKTRGWFFDDAQDVTLKENGDISVTQSRSSRGDAAASQHRRSINDNKKAWIETARRRADYRAKNATLGDVEDATYNKQLGSHQFSFDFGVLRFATLDEGKIVFPLSIVKASYYNNLDKERIGDLFQEHEVFLKDSIRIQIPEGYEVHKLPNLREKDSRAFQTEFKITQEKQMVKITRMLTGIRGRYPRGEFASLVAPIRAFHNMSNKVIVFRRIPPGEAIKTK